MSDEVRLIKLSLIVVPAHMRKHNPEKTSELAKDMKERSQLQHAVVTPMGDGRFELLAGDMFYEAAKLLGWEELRCLVKENVTEQDRAFITISDNENRDDVSPVDMGLAYRSAMEAGHMTCEALAKWLNKTDSHICEYVALAKLTQPVREISKRLKLDIGILKQIMRLKSDTSQIAIIERYQREGLSVKQLENLINKTLASRITGMASGPMASCNQRKSCEDEPNLKAQLEDRPSEAFSSSEVLKKDEAKDGFHISKSAKGIHIIGDFPATASLQDVIIAAEEAFHQWHAPPSHKASEGQVLLSHKAPEGQAKLRKTGKPHGAASVREPGTVKPSGWEAVSSLAAAAGLPTAVDGLGPVAFAYGKKMDELVDLQEALSDPATKDKEKHKLKEDIKKAEAELETLKGKLLGSAQKPPKP